jgi:beta-lactam-binding protein with PASTA domain
MVHCLLCGTAYTLTDPYCPGEQCGTDLHGQRTGDPACAVQAWCEPRRLTAGPGETVMVTLTLRNAGTAPDRYDPEIPRDVGRRVGLDRSGPPDVYPGEERVWTIVYTVPVDVGDSIAPSDLFGLGGMEADGGSAFEEASHVVEETEVAVRVVSARDMRVSACAPFSVRVVSTDRDHDRDGSASAPSGSARPRRDREHRSGRRGARIAGAAVATVAAIVVALLVGMAMAGSNGQGKPAAKSTTNGSARPSATSGASGTPAVEAPVTSTPDESTSASDSATASPSTSTSAPGKLTVPDVVGRTEAQGVALLRERGFRPAVVGSGGTIVSTDPGAGRKVDRDKADIVVTMSGSAASPGPPATTTAPAPPRQTPVPAVVGRSTSEARSRLEAVGLGVALVEVESSTASPDTVVRSNPGAGRLVPDGSTVTLTVARAPAPATSSPPPATTKAPGIVGLTVDGARARLRESGLTLAVDDPQSTCTVASQSPGEGAEVRAGGAVSATMATCRPV